MIYEVVLLLSVTILSVVSGMVSLYHFHLHQASGAIPNPEVLRFFMVFALASTAAAVCTLGGAITFLIFGRAPGETGYHIRFTIFTVRYIPCFVAPPKNQQACADFQALGIFCFIFTATERWVNRLTSRSDTSLELGMVRWKWRIHWYILDTAVVVTSVGISYTHRLQLISFWLIVLLQVLRLSQYLTTFIEVEMEFPTRSKACNHALALPPHSPRQHTTSFYTYIHTTYALGLGNRLDPGIYAWRSGFALPALRNRQF